MGALPEERKKISSGESSQWRVGKIIQKWRKGIVGLSGCLQIKEKKRNPSERS